MAYDRFESVSSVEEAATWQTDINGQPLLVANITEGGVPIIGTQQLEVRRGANAVCTIVVPVLAGEATDGPLIPGFMLTLEDYAEQMGKVVGRSIEGVDPPYTINDDPIVGSNHCQILDSSGQVVGMLSRPLTESKRRPLYD